MDTVDTLLLDLGDVHLRRPVMSDVPMIVEAVRGSLPNLRPWIVWASDDYGRQQAHDWVSTVMSRHDFELLVLDTEDEGMLGGVGLNRIDPVHRVANLAYWLSPAATGRGIATRVAAELALFGFNELALERIEIRAPVDHERAIATAERLGAVREGRCRRAVRGRHGQLDAFLYALLPTDREHLRSLVTDTGRPVA